MGHIPQQKSNAYVIPDSFLMTSYKQVRHMELFIMYVLYGTIVTQFTRLFYAILIFMNGRTYVEIVKKAVLILLQVRLYINLQLSCYYRALLRLVCKLLIERRHS